MSGETKVNDLDVPETTQADIRNAMSLDNLLVSEPEAPEASTALKMSEGSEEADVANETTSMNTTMTEPIEPEEDQEEAAAEDHDGGDDEGTDVPDAQREFICMNDEHTRCLTGQYTLDLSRKVISDHFGRNKACTRDITSWPLFCRKHYQRATYSKEKWQLRKVVLILRQFDVIEQEHPGTTYDVAFKKSEEGRLNSYSRQVTSGISNDTAEKYFAPVAGKHFEAPIEVLRELDQYVGRGKTYNEVKSTTDVILQMLEDKECEQVPAIEFLPQLPNKVVTPKKTPTKVRAAKSPKTPKTPSRLSAKGSVKKPAQKA
ncbi:hypothetical protein BDW02DRAFT_630479 [Decorospora gaudefroyi]|uniref:Uncharacterized protein n=1 Tax=Decorospora gaudefroyi TaxID=184978 RepID=A0A6A5KDG0_9PLEO|nr:hypothetical protein BDW02DRAFT_630479 [Decorospora gaudefroyi]